MNTRNQLWCAALASSLTLCLPHVAYGHEHEHEYDDEETEGESMVQSMSDMKFGELPGLPTCAKGAVQAGDPSEGPSIIIVKVAGGCTIPWHWHTPTENLMMVSGIARLDVKDGKPQTLRTGGFVRFPPQHVHQFTCKAACTFYLYSEDTFDIHYVDAQGNELSPDEALKAVKEKAAGAS